MCRGGSAIISPLGEVIAGPLYDSEGILLADLDLGEIVRAKLDFDVVGHYARPDVFQLRINEQARPPVQKNFESHPKIEELSVLFSYKSTNNTLNIIT